MLETVLYNFSSHQTISVNFPMEEAELENLVKDNEIVVDSCEGIKLDSEYTNPITLNSFLSDFEDRIEEIQILSQVFLLSRIIEVYLHGEYPIILNFDESTANWASASFTSEHDKGLCLFTEDLAILPADLPAEVARNCESYIDWAAIYRDMECNSQVNEVTFNGNHYLVLGFVD